MDYEGEGFDAGDTGDSGGSEAPVDDSSSRSTIEAAVRSQKATRPVSARAPRNSEPDEADDTERGKVTRLKDHDIREAIETSKEKRRQEAVVARVGTHFAGLAPHAERALQNGTNIQAAVESWVRAEDHVRRDPVNGTISTLQQIGWDPRQVIDAAWRGMNDPQTIHHNIAAMQQNRREYPHFEALRMDMSQIVAAGHAYNLDQAYRLALAWRSNNRRTNISSSRAAKGVH